MSSRKSGELIGQVLPGHLAQDGVMGSTRGGDGDGTVPHSHGGMASDEVTVECGGAAFLKSSQFLREHGGEGIGHHGECHIEVDLGQDG